MARARWFLPVLSGLAGAAALGGILFWHRVARAQTVPEAETPDEPAPAPDVPPGPQDADPRPGPVSFPRIQDRREARPDELVKVQNTLVERKTAVAYERLLAAARAAGFPSSLFDLVSGYRSDAKQRTLFEAAVKRYGSPEAARTWVAPPGNSSHRTGRALDLDLGGKNDSANVAHLRASAPGRWLRENAGRFGFALYDAEPWHIEYNPEGS